MTQHLAYAMAWLTFGAMHSWLSSRAAKNLLPLVPYYRVAFNLFAILHIGLVWMVGWWLFQPHFPMPRPYWLAWGMDAVWLAGIVIMVLGLKGYDLGRLAGTQQIFNHRHGIVEPEDEPLRTHGLHAHVRHPLYSGAFLILWGRVGNEFELATAIWASLYLIIGSRFEERRLEAIYGLEYALYRSRTPAFIPLPRQTGRRKP